jgi:ABC-type sugar transport system ATPase subunit
MTAPVIKMEDIYKHFDGRIALEHAHMELFEGEVLGLVGDNGAGKSTMLKILAGVLPADGGQISVRGNKVSVDSPRRSRALGIEMVYQDLALCGSLTVWENIYMGRLLLLPWRCGVLPFLDKRRMHRNASKLLRDLGIDLPDLGRPVRALSGGEQQAIAICRCLLFEPEVILLDEPTASMAIMEQEKILRLILDLKGKGRSLVMITHNLQELFRVADRALVLKGGRPVWCGPLSGMEPDDLARMMFTGNARRESSNSLRRGQDE